MSVEAMRLEQAVRRVFATAAELEHAVRLWKPPGQAVLLMSEDVKQAALRVGAAQLDYHDALRGYWTANRSTL